MSAHGIADRPSRAPHEERAPRLFPETVPSPHAPEPTRRAGNRRGRADARRPAHWHLEPAERGRRDRLPGVHRGTRPALVRRSRHRRRPLSRLRLRAELRSRSDRAHAGRGWDSLPEWPTQTPIARRSAGSSRSGWRPTSAATGTGSRSRRRRLPLHRHPSQPRADDARAVDGRGPGRLPRHQLLVRVDGRRLVRRHGGGPLALLADRVLHRRPLQRLPRHRRVVRLEGAGRSWRDTAILG